MHINGLLSAISGGYSVGRQEGLASTYPDLEGQDLALVEDYLDAYEKKGIQPERYLNTRRKITNRMFRLQQELEKANNEQKQLKILAKLLNFSKIMRETHVAPIYFAQSFFGEVPQSEEQELPANIPDKVKAALDVNFGKLYFRDYVAHRVRRAFFIPRLREQIHLSDSDRWIGICEEATRSTVIDTFDDENGKSYKPWRIAASLVHEAAHIGWFYKFASDPKMQELIWVERYAYIVESLYLSNLILKVEKDEKVTEEDKQEIAAAFFGVLDRIAFLNRKLGFNSDDYDLTK